MRSTTVPSLIGAISDLAYGINNLSSSHCGKNACLTNKNNGTNVFATSSPNQSVLAKTVPVLKSPISYIQQRKVIFTNCVYTISRRNSTFPESTDGKFFMPTHPSKNECETPRSDLPRSHPNKDQYNTIKFGRTKQDYITNLLHLRNES